MTAGETPTLPLMVWPIGLCHKILASHLLGVAASFEKGRSPEAPGILPWEVVSFESATGVPPVIGHGQEKL